MKILIVGKVPTHPILMGNSRLIVDQAISLRDMGHEVHYLYIHEVRKKERSDSVIPEKFNEMNEFWGEGFHLLKISKVRHLFLITRAAIKYHINNGYINPDDHYSPIIHREINRLDKIYEFDCIIVNYYYLSKALTKISIPRKAILTHDIFTYRDKTCHFKVRDSLTPNNEAKAVQRAQYILNVQSEDSIYFKKLSPNSTVLTTFTSFKYHPTPCINNHNILYLSGNSVFNYNGIIWFIDSVLPKLIDRLPDTQLIVGGSICNALQKYSTNPNIKLLGYIESPDKFFNLGDIFINPTYQGTGLKIKTFEGIAYDKAVITHPHSIIGIFDQENAPIYSSEYPEEWINRIIEIFYNREILLKVKNKNKNYLSKMNQFITSQYNIMLS